ncbi:cupin domain-containing protein [Rivularia sp. PCC 7116]|uniref:cupin domain-containing protein n=1 Tax=Rivularia sp. PCC 7116 TaxID=373994 RepID=UPI00029EDB0C|nr:cupin domain-containing protein [Rivularia sp. PCC 7116]AFY57026.1 cupin domain-containing protein [Rivularia sp. PCC 7116]
MSQQNFIDTNNKKWDKLPSFPATEILSLAQPVAGGSIHKLHMSAGTVIPVHSHPCDEYVYVLEGTIETAGRECNSGTFWFTPANTKNGSHIAITDVEILTIRLGEMGKFEKD